MNAPFEPAISPDIQNNPLVSYLKIFQNQHKVLTILYRGLMIAFAGFILLLTLLIFSIFDSSIMPSWGIAALFIFNLLLIAGISKGFIEIGRYRRRSACMLEQVYDYLRSDLEKLEKIKSEHADIRATHRKIQNRVLSFTSKSKRVQVEDHPGWDHQICPKCHTSVEMLMEECPQCKHPLGKIYAN